MTECLHYDAVCRAALATPGLKSINIYGSGKKNNYSFKKCFHLGKNKFGSKENNISRFIFLLQSEDQVKP